MLEVRLFGAGQASLLEQPLAGFPNQQVWLLLAYLMLNKSQAHGRERLAAVFWGDSPAHISRKNFRNTLWRLRQVFFLAGADPDDYLHIDENSVSFLGYSPFQLDVDEFEAAESLLEVAGQDLEPDQVSQLQKAVALYSGDLLENIYEDWCLYERERLRLVYLNMLYKLMAYSAVHGDYKTGLAYGTQLLRSDATREDVHRQMMWMYWRAGNRSAALAQYKLCCQILRDEIGAPPMEITRQFYEELLHAPDSDLEMSKIHSVAQSRNDEFLPVAESALQQLRHLQQILEQTNAQLLKIERLITQAVGDQNGKS